MPNIFASAVVVLSDTNRIGCGTKGEFLYRQMYEAWWSIETYDKHEEHEEHWDESSEREFSPNCDQ